MALMMTMGLGVFCALVVLFGDIKGDRHHRQCKAWIESNVR